MVEQMFYSNFTKHDVLKPVNLSTTVEFNTVEGINWLKNCGWDRNMSAKPFDFFHRTMGHFFTVLSPFLQMLTRCFCDWTWLDYKNSVATTWIWKLDVRCQHFFWLCWTAWRQIGQQIWRNITTDIKSVCQISSAVERRRPVINTLPLTFIDQRHRHDWSHDGSTSCLTNGPRFILVSLYLWLPLILALQE